MNEPEREEQGVERGPAFRRKVFQLLVQRSRQGGLVAALLATFLAFAGRDSPHAFWLEALVASTSLAALARWWVARRIDRAGDALAWSATYQCTVLATALAWGLCVAVLTWRDSAETVLLTLMVSAGVAAGGTTTLTAKLSLIYSYLSLLLLPMAVAAVAGERLGGAWLGASMAMFATYLVVHAKSLNAALLASLDSERLLKQRADRLESERTRAEAAQQRADDANHAKSAFLANMSHELRTPLTAIIGYAEQLLSADSAELRAAHAEVIRRNGEHLLEIVNDILDLSKIEAGKMTVLARPFSLLTLLVDLTSLMRPRALDKGLSFEIEAETAFPDRITADQGRVRQILLNLVGNAIKFTERGSVRVAIRLERPGMRLLIAVVDTGPGLTPESQQRLFSPFTQADDSPSRTHQGTGLGLFISRRFARMMAGEIRLQSEHGLGSTFTLELPLQSADLEWLVESAEGSIQPPEQAGEQAEQPLAGGHLLLAEDGLDNQALIAAILRQAGAIVDVVGDGEAAASVALQALRDGEPYDAILMDMQMPKLDGYGATGRLRAAGYRLPIIALTAHAMDAHRERSLASGCDDHVVKPIDRRALLEAIRRQLPAAHEPSAEAPLLHTSLPPDDLLNQLIPDFMQSLRGYVTALERAAAENDRKRLGYIAHQLKGTGGSYGYQSLTAAAAELETALEDGSPGLGPGIRKLIALCRGAIAAHEGHAEHGAS